MQYDELERILFQQSEFEIALLRDQAQVGQHDMKRQKTGASTDLNYHLDAQGYVNTDSMYEDQNGVFHLLRHPRYCAERSHKHRFYEILLVYSGSCTQVIDGETVVMQEGDICLLDTNSEHEILPLTAESIVLVIRTKDVYFANPRRDMYAENQLVHY